MANQAKGATSRILMDWEDTYKTARAAGDRRPTVVPFNSESIEPTQGLNFSETITGNINPTEPFEGNKDVQGSLTVPVDTEAFGRLMRAAMGAPTSTVESVWTTDVNQGGTITISSGTGTMSVAQTTAAVGDRILYTSSGTQYEAYLTAETSDTEWTVSVDRTASSAAADIAATTIDAIITNEVDAEDRTITISSGTATLSAAQSDAGVGDMIIYDIANTRAVCFITAVTSTTVFTVVDGLGLVPDDCTTLLVEAIEPKPWFTHTFKIHATDSIPSFILDKKLDLDTPTYVLILGCKVNSVEIGATGGDNELLATFNIVGASWSRGATAYDAGASPTASNILGDKFQNSDASAEEGGSTISTLTDFMVMLNRNLDLDSRCIGGAGERSALPEGIAGVNGNVTGLFTDTTVLAKAEANTESSLQLAFSSGSDSLTLDMPEVKYPERVPTTPSARGLRINLDWLGYYNDNSDSTALKATLVNQQEKYT